MADSEYFDPLFLLKFKLNVYLFLQGLNYSVLSVSGKKFDSHPSIVFKFILLPTPCCYGLGVMLNSCILSDFRVIAV